MTDSDYKDQIQKSWGEISKLNGERKLIDIQIGKLRELIKANANMLASDSDRDAVLDALEAMKAPAGMSDAIKKTLMEHRGEGLTPAEIRDILSESGYDLSDQSNALASISTTLRRMVPDDATEVTRKDGKKAYARNLQMKPIPNWFDGITGINSSDMKPGEHPTGFVHRRYPEKLLRDKKK